jgi:hypothetical protein
MIVAWALYAEFRLRVWHELALLPLRDTENPSPRGDLRSRATLSLFPSNIRSAHPRTQHPPTAEDEFTPLTRQSPTGYSEEDHHQRFPRKPAETPRRGVSANVGAPSEAGSLGAIVARPGPVAS